jgi:hypothetical protein
LQEGVRDLAIVGGVESLSRVQIGLNQKLSDWLRHFLQARSLGARLETFSELHWNNIRLHIPADRQSHDRQEHGGAHRRDGKGMAYQPRGTG